MWIVSESLFLFRVGENNFCDVKSKDNGFKELVKEENIGY